MKKYSKFEKTVIMNQAKASYIIVEKKDKLNEKIAEERAKMEQKFAEKTAKYQAEIEDMSKMLEKFEAPIKDITDGKASYELVTKTVEEVTDDNGTVTRKTKYTFNEEVEDPANVEDKTPETPEVENFDDFEGKEEAEAEADPATAKASPEDEVALGDQCDAELEESAEDSEDDNPFED